MTKPLHPNTTAATRMHKSRLITKQHHMNTPPKHEGSTEHKTLQCFAPNSQSQKETKTSWTIYTSTTNLLGISTNCNVSRAQNSPCQQRSNTTCTRNMNMTEAMQSNTTATLCAETHQMKNRECHMNKLHDHDQLTATQKCYVSRRKIAMATEATPHEQAT